MATNLSRTAVVAKLIEQITARAKQAVIDAIQANPLSDENEIEQEVRFRVLAEEVAKAQYQAGILPEKK